MPWIRVTDLFACFSLTENPLKVAFPWHITYTPEIELPTAGQPNDATRPVRYEHGFPRCQELGLEVGFGHQVYLVRQKLRRVVGKISEEKNETVDITLMDGIGFMSWYCMYGEYAILSYRVTVSYITCGVPDFCSIKRYLQDFKQRKKFKSYRYEGNESTSQVIWVCDPNLRIPGKPLWKCLVVGNWVFLCAIYFCKNDLPDQAL